MKLRYSISAALCALLVAALPATAQNFSDDARTIAMGGVGEEKNAAMQLAGPRQYRSVLLPLGLIQVFRQPSVFNPDSDNFDPVRALELAANPLHLTFTRTRGDAGERLVRDLVEGRINRDLNTYRGFAPERRFSAKGLISPNWGKTFRVHERAGSIYHGIYVGAGPYLSADTELDMDEPLSNILGSAVSVYLPNTGLNIRNNTSVQAAGAITGGYRMRIGVPGRGRVSSDREGLYLAANYNHLLGFHYDEDALNVRFDTDPIGLITILAVTRPFELLRASSSKGRGFALDLAGALVADRWEFALAANGVGNRINWENVKAEEFVLTSLLEGLDFVNRDLPGSGGKRQVKLPVRYIGAGTYNEDAWSATIEMARSLQGLEFRAGGEYRWSFMEFRGGGRYSKDRWYPSGGVGFSITRKLGVDIAAFGTATNIERERTASIAVSLRLY